eukprot:SAG31_NODE_876_length_11307_cov_3.506781_4_plen_201_part_00
MTDEVGTVQLHDLDLSVAWSRSNECPGIATSCAGDDNCIAFLRTRNQSAIHSPATILLVDCAVQLHFLTHELTRACFPPAPAPPVLHSQISPRVLSPAELHSASQTVAEAMQIRRRTLGRAAAAAAADASALPPPPPPRTVETLIKGRASFPLELARMPAGSVARREVHLQPLPLPPLNHMPPLHVVVREFWPNDYLRSI